MWEIWVRSLGLEDTLEKGMVTHSSIFAWRIPWTEDWWGSVQNTESWGLFVTSTNCYCWLIQVYLHHSIFCLLFIMFSCYFLFLLVTCLGFHASFSDLQNIHFVFNSTLKWSEVTQLCPTLCDPVDCSPTGSSVHGLLQARILEWAAISFSRGSSQPRDWTQVSCIAGRHFNLWTIPTLAFSLIIKLKKNNITFHSPLHKAKKLKRLYFPFWLPPTIKPLIIQAGTRDSH